MKYNSYIYYFFPSTFICCKDIVPKRDLVCKSPIIGSTPSTNIILSRITNFIYDYIIFLCPSTRLSFYWNKIIFILVKFYNSFFSKQFLYAPIKRIFTIKKLFYILRSKKILLVKFKPGYY